MICVIDRREETFSVFKTLQHFLFYYCILQMQIIVIDL